MAPRKRAEAAKKANGAKEAPRRGQRKPMAPRKCAEAWARKANGAAKVGGTEPDRAKARGL